jgi:NAD-dependent dihydropyrimidine dehydrogenase PreA subunit
LYAYFTQQAVAAHGQFRRFAARQGGQCVTYVITQPCIDVKDKSCVDVCPVSCIYIESDDLDRKLYIHPDECIDCGACEPECPVNAIFEQSAVPPEWQEFIELDKRWNTGDQGDRNAVRARINEIQPPAS